MQGPLTTAGLIDEAQVYHAMWHASGGHVTPRVVDEMTMWEIAVVLGVSDECSPKDAAAPSDSDPTGREMMRRRLAHAQGLGPKPEAPAIDPATFQALTGALG